MDKKEIQNLEIFLEELKKDNPEAYIAMQLFSNESSTSSISCSPHQLYMMLLILCQEHHEFIKAILLAAQTVEEWDDD